MSVLFEYPATGPVVDTLTLPNPDLGNPDSINLKTNRRFGMNGTVYSYKRTPTFRTLGMTFSTLREEVCGSVTHKELTDLLSFIESHIGLVIKLTDWDSVVWEGKLTTDPVAVIEGQNFYSTTISFEGNKV